MEKPSIPDPETIAHGWQSICLARLQRLLKQTPADAPLDLTPIEAFALIEWARIAMFAECHTSGSGSEALALLKTNSASAPDPLPDHHAL